jgi:hypothetical protein
MRRRVLCSRLFALLVPPAAATTVVTGSPRAEHNPLHALLMGGIPAQAIRSARHGAQVNSRDRTFRPVIRSHWAVGAHQVVVSKAGGQP